MSEGLCYRGMANASIQDAGHMVVVDGGTITERGTHADLLVADD